MNATQRSVRSVVLVCSAPGASSVSLVGDFNDWDVTSTPMRRRVNGDWEARVRLTRGAHEYKFVVDGEWCCTPGAGDSALGEGDLVPNCFGTSNRVVVVR